MELEFARSDGDVKKFPEIAVAISATGVLCKTQILDSDLRESVRTIEDLARLLEESSNFKWEVERVPSIKGWVLHGTMSFFKFDSEVGYEIPS